MKILVTGANGQLGNELRVLSEYIPQWTFVFTDVDTLDITNEEAVREFFRVTLPSVIINCAAYTAVDKAETEPDMARKINAEAPGILARCTAELSSKLIHTSTDYVFDGLSDTPYTETDDVNPTGVYGKTKLEGELNCLFENPESIIIRTSWLYSTFGNNFVKTMMRIGKEKKEVSVVTDQVGSPTYAADLANVILNIIAFYEQDPDNFIPGVYHYSNQGAISWFTFAKEIFRLTAIPCTVNPILTKDYPSATRRPAYSVMDNSKIMNTFGIVIPQWDKSLKVCISKF